MNTTSHTPSRLGIDIGRVIIDGPNHPNGGDTAFFSGDEPTMLATPAVTDAFVAIHDLVQTFASQVWLISKCGPRVQARTRRWLEHHNFYDHTGLNPAHVRFCLQRVDKRIHCQELEITHLVDDRLDVHEAVRELVPNLYVFGPQRRPIPRYVLHTPDWPSAADAIHASLRTERDGTCVR